MYKKYEKYKIKYINLKQMIQNAGTGECKKIQIDDNCVWYINSLKNEIKMLAKENNINNADIEMHINNWFNGIFDSNTPLSPLLDPLDMNLTKPLWWSTFDFAQNFLNKFSTEDSLYTNVSTRFGDITNGGSFKNFKKDCKQNESLINIFSSFFTLNRNDSADTELKLTLLLNKDHVFQHSYFYNTELEVILKYCLLNKKNCNIFISNLKNNCSNVVLILKERADQILTVLATDKVLKNHYTPTITITCVNLSN